MPRRSSNDSDSAGAARFLEVAVPLPLSGALTYALPAGLDAPAGSRVRVTVGPRRLTGVVLRTVATSPDGVRVKPIEEVLDAEPVIPEELLDLARFAAEYYLAPIGETVRALLPSDLPRWGDRRVALTNAGALAPPRDEAERAIIESLLEHRRLRVAALRRLLPEVRDLGRRIEDLHRLGRLSMEEPGGRGTRYVKAVELRPGALDAHLETVGRAPKGRAVVELLHALGRPATLAELRAEVGCGPAVVRRLEQKGLLRTFTQPERLTLERHRLGGDDESTIILRPDQAQAVAAVEEALDAREYAPYLLHGTTGAGKTEVYLRAVRACLDRGRAAVLLVPEIALVPALASQVRARFGRELAILHSNLSSAERLQEWERIRRGEARVVLGPRSALLAPVDDLGLIVVDEEHDGAYKQDQTPRYNGRDLALWRGRHHRAAAILVSATPSLESRHNVAVGKLGKLTLRGRHGGARMPEGVLVDLREHGSAMAPGEVYFSGVLQAEIRSALDAGDQIILLRNRRGYAPVLLCRACGEDFRCADCGLSMTFHLRGAYLGCHYCGQEQPAPSVCPTCGDEALEPMGAGTERVEEKIRDLYPDVPVDTLDADAARRTGGAAAVLERFRRGTTQVLIGTQMVSKGHHFPRVALAAVLFADSYLGFPDFRAVERTYALLAQLAGRAGRGERPGKVVIQTFHPQHYAVRAALTHDDALFADEEMRFRRIFHYPPFTRMVQVLAQHEDAERAESTLRMLAARLRAQRPPREVHLLGPAPAPFERLRGRWRWQLLLRGPSSGLLRRLLRAGLDDLPAARRGDLTLDVDPYDLL
ncbi:MAG: primosomal protein N' [Acidobacteriota bacterium]